MNINANLFTGAVTLVVTASTILAGTNASAYPGNDERDIQQNNNRTEQDRDRYNNNRIQQNNNRTEQDRRRYNNNRVRRYERRYDNYRSYGYPDRIKGPMPNDFRRVVYHNRTYYTRDNYYYTYEPSSRSFINVRLPFFSIPF
jgi:hypothetical protein